MEKVVMCALDYATPLQIQTSPAHSSSSTDTSSEIGSAFNSPTQGSAKKNKITRKKNKKRKKSASSRLSLYRALCGAHNRLVVHTFLLWQNIRVFGHVMRIDLMSSDPAAL